jgi:hypothetical protein
MKTVESYLPTASRVHLREHGKYCEGIRPIMKSMDIVEARMNM